MKLGEALTQRSQLLVRMKHARDRLKDSALVQEGEQPPEDPRQLLSEFEAMANELQSLIARINQTNLTTRLATGETLTEALARRDVLGLRIRAVRQVADVAAARQERYSQSEIRFVATVNVADLRKAGDDLARELRELDASMQETNWTTDLID